MIRSAILLTLIASLSFSQEVVVGAIEQKFHGWEVDSLNPFVVRVAFKKDSGQWKPFPTDFEPPNASKAYYPGTLSWNICFDGRNLGSISSYLPDNVYYYSEIGIHYIRDVSKVPRIGKPQMDFSGWMATPVYRPLVVSTSPFCTDLDRWKPYKPTPGDISTALNHADTSLIKRASSAAERNFKVLKSYSSQREKLICMVFDTSSAAPSDTNDFIYSDSDNTRLAWFLLSGSSCVYIRSNMLLLDAGDYDNDGKAEVVFKFEEYDHDGYILYYDDFRQMSLFGWIYH
jgi:hypothetical protein